MLSTHPLSGQNQSSHRHVCQIVQRHLCILINSFKTFYEYTSIYKVALQLYILVIPSCAQWRLPVVLMLAILGKHKANLTSFKLLH